MLGGNFNVVAQHAIMFDLQRLDLGFRTVARLQTGNHAAAFAAQLARLIKRCVIAVAHEPAIARQNWQCITQRDLQSLDQLRQTLRHFIRAEACQRGQHQAYLVGQISGRTHLRQPRAHRLAAVQANRECLQIARAAARQHQPAQRAHHIGQVFKLPAHIFARGVFVDKKPHRPMPRANFGHIAQRGGQPVSQFARARRRNRHVDGCQQTAGLFACLGAGQFKVRPRCRIQPQMMARRFDMRAGKAGHMRDLGLLQISQQSAACGDVGAR